jgi:hypothetical protein
MANLTLIYGMRLLPSEEAIEVGDATVTLKNGKEAHVTMHVLEGRDRKPATPEHRSLLRLLPRDLVPRNF